MTTWGKISVGWVPIYGPSPYYHAGTYLVVFLSSEGCFIPSKTAVVNDFGDLVEVRP